MRASLDNYLDMIRPQTPVVYQAATVLDMTLDHLVNDMFISDIEPSEDTVNWAKDGF